VQGGWATANQDGYLGMKLMLGGQVHYGYLFIRHHVSGVYAIVWGGYEDVANTPLAAGMTPPTCATADFDNDGAVGTDADIEALFACIAGNCCVFCRSADVNGDGAVATDADIETFFRILAGDC
jgi:hypothetical protein